MVYRLALSAALFALLSVPAFAAVFDSAYSRFDFERCVVAPSPEPGVIDVRICHGRNDIDVVWTSEPDSSDIGFGATPKYESLDLGPFHEASNTIEWRLRTRRGATAPFAAIVRYDLGDRIGHLDRHRLIVYRLDGNRTSCVIGMIDAARPNANGEARQMADRWGPSFVCGVSAPR
jgi:hypothetical protein